MRAVVVALLTCSALCLTACETAPAAPTGDGGALDAESGERCGTDDECDDGLFCTGRERCAPGLDGADARGCAPAVEAPCADGMRCDERADRCETLCDVSADADGDGARSSDCGGADCDDADPNRYPGNREFCDAEAHDEDCDPTTFGFRDVDGDDVPDAMCCNVDDEGVPTCGTDCDDMRAGVSPEVPEVCNGRDDDCDTRADEDVLVALYRDADGDLHGDPTMSRQGCPDAEPGYVALDDDCDDADPGSHPGQDELCDRDLRDDDCDGERNEGCECRNGDATACERPGVCGVGQQTCVDGRFTECVVRPGVEICDDLDNDCDASTDEGFAKVTCYVDADDDGVAPMGATSRLLCADETRAARGRCPLGFTSAAPDATTFDCADDDAARAWSTLTCWRDDDGDGYACPETDADTWDCRAGAGGAQTSAEVVQCPDAMGTCNPGYTARDPGAGPASSLAASDCNDATSGGALHTWTRCFRDADADGRRGSATPLYFCGPSCPAGYVATSTGSLDCCDSDARAYPGQLSSFDTARSGCGGYDFDCDGASTPDYGTSSVTCDLEPELPEGCIESGEAGFTGSAPACGGSGTLVLGCDTRCRRATASRRQSCR